MKTNLKTYIVGILLFIVGIFIGVSFFSSEEKQDKHDHSQEQSENVVWTCSMHPQIRQDEAGDCPICGMDLITASTMEENIDPDAIMMSKTAQKLAQVETTIIGKQESHSKVNFSGRLEINLDNTSSISVNFKARIERLYVNAEGEMVNKGEVIAELYSPEIQVLKEELELANRQENEMLLKSITAKIKNYQLDVKDVQSIEAGRLKLRSPKTGVISNLKVKEGDNLKANESLLSIANLSSLWAIIDVYENELKNIKTGDKLTIKIPNRNELTGEVSFISPTLDQSTRSAKARIVVDNTNLNLKPGIFIRAELINSKSSTEQSLMIPKSALLWTGKRSVVYQQMKKENNVYFKMKEVEIGTSSSDFVEIISGLKAGDEIVTHGAFSIDSEAQLANKPSMMNKDSKASTEDHKHVDMEMQTAAFQEISWEDMTIKSADFEQIINTYLKLKEALTEDNESKALQLANQLKTEISNLSIEDKAAKQSLIKLIKTISTSKNIEQTRLHFQYLSNAMIALAKNTNPLNETLYVQFCPMADNDQGAFWLSKEEEIKNPYFGSMMLKCGTVDQTITAK